MAGGQRKLAWVFDAGARGKMDGETSLDRLQAKPVWEMSNVGQTLDIRTRKSIL